MRWRDRDTVRVGWLGRPEMGELDCEVIKRDRTNNEPHGVRIVQWNKGIKMEVAYCHSEQRYVFKPHHPGSPTLER